MKCSFCDKPETEVFLMIAEDRKSTKARPQVAICNECILICNSLLIRRYRKGISKVK